MKKILIIEDDQIVANIYRNKFINEGFDVTTAADGEMGFQTATEYRPDVVVLDLMLPKITGTDLMKKIRAEPGMEQVPIIVFSNTYLTNLVQEAWKAGATKCLSKANCTPRQLIEVINSVTAGAAAKPNGGAPAPVAQLLPKPAPKIDQPAAPDRVDDELRKRLLKGFPSTLTAMRTSHQGILKSANESDKLKSAAELFRHVHSLTGSASVCGLPAIALMGDALEALLNELNEKPQSINVSTLRTVASAIDFVAFLFDHASRNSRQEIPSAKALVVDDEAISRRAVIHALEKVKLKGIEVEDPNRAYDLLLQNRYDLVFLDVDMPGMNGFELCSKIRSLPAYKKTPVVFVTSLTDFESRASSMMSGGNDFIGKPFLFMELGVKALVYVLRAKLDPAKQ